MENKGIGIHMVVINSEGVEIDHVMRWNATETNGNILISILEEFISKMKYSVGGTVKSGNDVFKLAGAEELQSLKNFTIKFTTTE